MENKKKYVLTTEFGREKFAKTAFAMYVAMIFSLIPLGFWGICKNPYKKTEIILAMLLLAVILTSGALSGFTVLEINGQRIRCHRRKDSKGIGGDRTIYLNKNKRLEFFDKLYIMKIKSIPNSYNHDRDFLILSNVPIPENYELQEDRNAITVVCTDKIIKALEENFDCVFVN